MTPEEIRETVREQLLDAFSAEYSFTVDTWKLLETKAQVSITVSGIFFAAAFAYARETTLTTGVRLLLLSTVVTLLLSLGSAIRSLTIARIAVPPFGSFFEPIARDVFRHPKPQIDEEFLLAITGDLVTQWRKAIETANHVNAEKSQYVLASQILLGLAMLIATILTVVYVT